VLAERPVTLTLLTNPAQSILPGIVEESLSLLADGTFYLHRLVGDQLQLIAAGPPPGQDTMPDVMVAGIAVAFNRAVDQVLTYFDPPVVKLATAAASAAEAEEEVNLGVLFVPSILLMSLLFWAQGLGNDIWQERQQSTLRRVAVAPHDLTRFLAGKLLAAAGVMATVCVIGLTVGYLYLKLPLRSLPLAVVWSTLAGCLLLAILMTIQLFTTSQRMGNIVTLVLIFPLMMLGGSFFPFEAMPEWMVAIGRWTPNGWALEMLKQIMLERATAGELIQGVVMIAAIVGLLFAVGARRLRAGFALG
jgi:ABC-type multidrug transport system permease subunit